MPPYTPVVSKAQSRKLFALASEGKISMADAEGKTRAVPKWDRLPNKIARARGRSNPATHSYHRPSTRSRSRR